MRQLSKLQNVLFIIGGAFMVIGACCFAFGFIYQRILLYSSWIFLVGTVLFGGIQAMQVYEGTSCAIHRLKKIQLMADILFVLAGISMVDTIYAFARRWFENYETYITYFYNKWVLILLIAAVLELYTTHRISHELHKEECK